MITKPGIFTDIDPAAYHADPCPEPSVTQSLVKVLLDQSPAHAKHAHPRLAPPVEADDETEKYVKARAIGDAAHMLLLGRGKRLRVIEADSFRTKIAQEHRNDAVLHGQTPILEKHFQIADDMYRAAIPQLAARDLWTQFQPNPSVADSEVVLAWQEGGIWCRTMIDRLSADCRRVLDVKTTERNAAPHAIGPLVQDWIVQAAMHERGLNVLDPDSAGRRTHTFVVQEQYPPYALVAYDLPESVMHMGRKTLAIGLEIWGECMRTGAWPAYPTETQIPELPSWHERRMLDRELAHEERRREGVPSDILAAG